MAAVSAPRLAPKDIKARYRGSLLGLAAGDAVGTAVEFKPRGSFKPVTDMRGGGPFNLPIGAWTDDTSMALCMAESLVIKHTYDPGDIMKRFISWMKSGHLSSTGHCFDIGIQTRGALLRYKPGGDPYTGTTDERSSGNGSLMRLTPIPLFFAYDAAEAIEKAGDSSRLTHGSLQCVDACRYYASLIVGAAVYGASKEELLSPLYFPGSGNYWETHPITSTYVYDIALKCAYKTKSESEVQGTGWVIASLEAALWAFANSSTFEEGCLKVVNLGDDADTTAAIYGQLAGAYYGEEGIPEKWRKQLVMKKKIEEFADGLFEHAKTKGGWNDDREAVDVAAKLENLTL